MKVPCPALQTLQNVLTCGSSYPHIFRTSVGSASLSDEPANNLIGTRIFPKFQTGGFSVPQCTILSALLPQSKALKTPPSNVCFQCSIFIKLVPEGQCPAKTSKRSALSSKGSASIIMPTKFAHTCLKAAQKRIPVSVRYHLGFGMNSLIPRDLNQFKTCGRSIRLMMLELA